MTGFPYGRTRLRCSNEFGVKRSALRGISWRYRVLCTLPQACHGLRRSPCWSRPSLCPNPPARNMSLVRNLKSAGVGVAFPLATFTSANGASSSTTIAEDFNVNFPFGFGVKPNWSPVVFDLELVPEVHPNVRSTTFLVHPGVVWPLPDGWAV